MSNQQAHVGSADAQEQAMNSQVNLFLFDLKNEATEHGFKDGESWNLELVTETEMIDLKRHHYPIISVRLLPHALLKVYQQVKSKLQQSLTPAEASLTAGDLANTEKRHLAAYPARSNRK
ncbi:hypothetical protein C8P68_10168 [Mucilaginibacter yixingensis]|uniref:Uncharacterized protein n=1 Tax=Mucilaginibacter yixingensis TaxID=1295612 RepID=A0A2T5JEG8_9SPHI|nr:hypothetical protein [Mucilaginibacter yixingensis]PTR00840.1 hypothetical protein C8P68_10168 [Mucilaginibacter yixingensis]